MTANKLRINTAADLMAALASPNLGVRLAVLQAIARNPEKALAYGKYQDRDVVDELISHVYQKVRFTYLRAVLTALAAFREPRVIALFKKMLAGSQKPDLIFKAADRLAMEPPESLATISRSVAHAD